MRYFSAKSALRAFNLWSALECVKVRSICCVSIKYEFLFDKSRQISINIM